MNCVAIIVTTDWTNQKRILFDFIKTTIETKEIESKKKKEVGKIELESIEFISQVFVCEARPRVYMFVCVCNTR